ncbi:hypothetical protein GJ744_000370 [Endocarpon pusillum]|uniref:Uncharacterized protein n=1 Tax=Endocarpon pusillum TaxID=364733 RepID=A0A8H7E946_9EURO|nr:hypothetical protein GJ744_000370 [Endocarpon pusillum]
MKDQRGNAAYLAKTILNTRSTSAHMLFRRYLRLCELLRAGSTKGSTVKAILDASYDGALEARGMHSLQSYREDKPVHDNNAYTITSIYHGGQLKMYTSHPAQLTNPGSRPEYCMTQLNT